MNLREARIGWSGYSPDFSVPGDRRRFAAYAAERGLTYERARIDRPYDLVLITHHSDLPAWIDRKCRDGDKLKLVFELIDSYLADRSRVRRFLKGVGRFALGNDSRLSLDFLKTLTNACSAADAVICATSEQQQAIRRLNENVHISFDWFGAELGEPKSDYRRHGRLRLVWEGQSTTVGNLDAIREQLDELADEIELHVVTDPEVRRYYGCVQYRTKTLLKGFRPEPLLHNWDRTTFSDHVTSADVAIIPIDPEDDFAMGKPENKLVMLWKLGMPVLASATPAYRRTMDAAGLDLLCANSADWREKLRGMLDASADDLQAACERARQFAERNYSKQEFLSRFDAAFASVGFRV
jgi:glycosyltransferase involved in cell wall biosynthesis